MTSMTTPTTRVMIGGVDTHGAVHHAAVIDEVGRQLGDREFPASPAGYRALAAWLGEHGTLTTIGVEGTGSYGAGLARYLRSIGLTAVEVDRPDRKSRRAHGKSDPLDAYAAAKPSCRGRRRGCRSCAMAASRPSGRSAWPAPARSRPVARPRIRSRL